MPCVTDRFYNSGWKFDYTDDAPGSGKYLNAHDGSRGPAYVDSSNTKATSGTGKTASDPTATWNYETKRHLRGCGNRNQILPLTQQQVDTQEPIGNLEAYGATGGVLGTAFPWYMLSPNWKSDLGECQCAAALF